MNNTITQLKNTLDGFNSKLDKTVERITDVEDKAVELTQLEQQKENKTQK